MYTFIFLFYTIYLITFVFFFIENFCPFIHWLNGDANFIHKQFDFGYSPDKTNATKTPLEDSEDRKEQSWAEHKRPGPATKAYSTGVTSAFGKALRSALSGLTSRKERHPRTMMAALCARIYHWQLVRQRQQQQQLHSTSPPTHIQPHIRTDICCN